MSSRTHRILAGAGALMLFGALFALPVYAAMSLCTMPCCHHNGSAGVPVMGLDMARCAPSCSVRTEEATEATAHAVATPAGKTIGAAPAAAPTALSTALDTPPPPVCDTGQPRSAPAPVYVLNSVFRI